MNVYIRLAHHLRQIANSAATGSGKTAKSICHYLKSLIKNLSTSQLTIIALSTFACFVLVWVYFDRVASFEASHYALARTSSVEVASQISFILKERQRHVQLFAEDNQERLRQLRIAPENDTARKEMGLAIKRIFPDYFAFTITDIKGEPIMDDFDGFVGDICVQDIKVFAKNHQNTARIHPNNYHYHFDVMAEWHDADATSYFLMVSFEPTELSQLLKAIEPQGHNLMLITNTSQPMIEVTANGGRDKTPRSDYRLSEEELARILARYPVELSGWEVADLEQLDFFSNYRSQTRNSLTVFLLTFSLAIGASLVLLRREELRRQAAEHDREELVSVITQMALYDSLTKLPNRRLLNDRLNQAMDGSRRSGRYGALMFLDLDNFKPINDTHGHFVGDLLLTEAANRLKNIVRGLDTVARLGGDEFVVMLNELDIDKVKSTSQANIVAEKIRETLSKLYLLTINHEGKVGTTIEHHCTVSIGVALFVDHKTSQDDILKRADAAMYQAKEAGRNLIRFYDSND